MNYEEIYKKKLNDKTELFFEGKPLNKEFIDFFLNLGIKHGSSEIEGTEWNQDKETSKKNRHFLS